MTVSTLWSRRFHLSMAVSVVVVVCVFSLAWVLWEKNQCSMEVETCRRTMIHHLLGSGEAILREIKRDAPDTHVPFRFGASGSVAVLTHEKGIWGEMPGSLEMPRTPASKAFADQVLSWFSQLYDGKHPVVVQDLSLPEWEDRYVHLVAMPLDKRGAVGVAAVADWEVEQMLAPYRRAVQRHLARFMTGLALLAAMTMLVAVIGVCQLSRGMRREVETFSASLGVALSTGQPMRLSDDSLVMLEPLVSHVNNLIGELNQALADLRDSELRYRRLFQGNAMGIWVLDARELLARFGELRAQGVSDLHEYMRAHPDFPVAACRNVRVLDANREAVRMYGAGSKSLLISSLDQVLGDRDFDQFREILAGLFNGEGRIQVLGTGTRLDGSRMDVLYTVFRLERRETGLLAMNTLDVTARMTAMRELAEETEQLQTLLASMTDGVIVTDRKGRIARINEAACRLTGFTEMESIGYPLEQVYRTTSCEDKFPEDPGVRPFLRNGRGETMAPVVLHGKHGRKCFVEERRSALLQRDGRFAGMVLVLRDVTDQRAVQEELVRARKLQSLGVFAGGIAHQFNNLMTALFGRVTLARMYAASGTPVDRKLDEAERLMDKARGLTAKLLTFSKGGEPVRSRKPLRSLIGQALSLMDERADVKVDVDIPDDLPDVNVDEVQVVQMLDCLFQNAVDASEGGCRVIISARSVDAGGMSGLDAGSYVRVDVTDNGPGIPEDVLDRVFDPYFTTREHGQGLGLSIVYGIVKRHGGHVTAENTGAGARITVYLPAVGG